MIRINGHAPRAIYRRPQVLILDEALDAMDYQRAQTATKVIQALLPEVALLVITHRGETVMGAQTVYWLESGRITLGASGPEATYRFVRSRAAQERIEETAD